MRASDFPMHCRTAISCTYRATGRDCYGGAVLLFAFVVGVIYADGSVYGVVHCSGLLSASIGVVLGWAVCGGMDWAICRA